MQRKKLLIGRLDIADFPEIGISNVPCKVDTGAFTSAIAYHHAEEIQLEGGTSGLKVFFFYPEDDFYTNEGHLFKEFSKRDIKNSFGNAESRYIVKTSILLFGKEFRTEFSLSKRKKLKFPVLLGRKLLQNRFIVDVSKRNLSHKSKGQKVSS